METIEINGEKISLPPIKGKHSKKGMKLLATITGSDNEVEALNSLTDYIEELACELTGKSMEWLDDLYEEDKNKIVGHYMTRITAKFDFMKTLLQQQSS